MYISERELREVGANGGEGIAGRFEEEKKEVGESRLRESGGGQGCRVGKGGGLGEGVDGRGALVKVLVPYIQL